MPTMTAIYLDLTDPVSALAWDWLTVIKMTERIEVRPFCLSVPEPWECTSPPLSLELLMLLEQARDGGPPAMRRVIRAAFDRIEKTSCNAVSPHHQLALWLAVRSAAGLGLAQFEETMDRLRAEVGYWQAEAIDEHGISGVPTLLRNDGTTIQLHLTDEVLDPANAWAAWQDVTARLVAVSPSSDR